MGRIVEKQQLNHDVGRMKIVLSVEAGLMGFSLPGCGRLQVRAIEEFDPLEMKME